MARVRLHWYYFRRCAVYNLPVTAVAAGLASGVNSLADNILEPVELLIAFSRLFAVTYMSLGSLFGFFMYHVFLRNEYPMYYNAGIRIRRSIVIVSIANLLIGTAVLILLWALRL